MRLILIFFVILFGFIFNTTFLSAQAHNGKSVLDGEFAGTEQTYIAVFDEDGIAEFRFVFLSLNTYRILIQTKSISPMCMQMIDINGNILFDGQLYGCPDYWDFSFDRTQMCRIKLITKNIEAHAQNNVEVIIGYKRFK